MFYWTCHQIYTDGQSNHYDFGNCFEDTTLLLRTFVFIVTSTFYRGNLQKKRRKSVER